jgi:hypothetical protein
MSVSDRAPARSVGWASGSAMAPAADAQPLDSFVHATYKPAKSATGPSSDLARLLGSADKVAADGTEDHAMVAMPSTTSVAGDGPTQLRLVNSKRISFNYQVRDAGPGTKVAVWWTQDMKSWKKCETLKQASTSCLVAVKDDGLYGFVLRARSDDPQEHPASGDIPQVWVAVDTTRPVVKLLGTEMNETARVPTLVVRWSAQDKNFGPRPMTLSYSEKPEGPWTTLAANVENTGHYEWPLPSHVPFGIYLRIEAADLMSNIGAAKTVNKLLLPQIQTASADLPVKPASAALHEPAASAPAVLPKIPSIDLPRPAPPHRPQVSILSVEPEKD